MRLDKLATISTGIVAVRKQAKLPDVKNIKYKILNLKAIRKEGYIVSSLLEEFEANAQISEKYLAQAGDIVVRLSAPYTAVLINETYKGIIIPSHFAVIRVDSKRLLPEYLYWFLNTEKLRQIIVKSINSMTIGTVKPMSYASLNIELITLEEQKKIGQLYMLAKKEKYLLEKIMEQKDLYYKETLKKIQNEMRRKNENNEK